MRCSTTVDYHTDRSSYTAAVSLVRGLQLDAGNAHTPRCPGSVGTQALLTSGDVCCGLVATGTGFERVCRLHFEAFLTGRFQRSARRRNVCVLIC